MTEQAPAAGRTPKPPAARGVAQRSARGEPVLRSSARVSTAENPRAALGRCIGDGAGPVAQIATEAGVTQQGLLYYFPSKDELLHAALDIRDQRDVSTASLPGKGWSSSTGSWIASAGGARTRDGRHTRLLLVENLGDHAPLRDRLEKRYSLVHKEYADGIRAAQANGTARADIDPDLKAVEVIAFLDRAETSWLLNPSLPVEDVAAAWRDSRLCADDRRPQSQGVTQPNASTRRGRPTRGSLLPGGSRVRPGGPNATVAASRNRRNRRSHGRGHETRGSIRPEDPRRLHPGPGPGRPGNPALCRT